MGGILLLAGDEDMGGVNGPAILTLGAVGIHIVAHRAAAIGVDDRVHILHGRIGLAGAVDHAAVSLDVPDIVALDIIQAKRNRGQAQGHDHAQNQSNDFFHVYFLQSDFVRSAHHGCEYKHKNSSRQ